MVRVHLIAVSLAAGFLLLARSIQNEPVQTAQPADCLQAPPCNGAVHTTILQLVRDGNRYDRRAVRVNGKVQMLKLRKNRCGDYAYFVLKDREGYFVSVTDYTNNREYSERYGELEVTGFYRAELHNLDVCREVKR